MIAGETKQMDAEQVVLACVKKNFSTTYTI